MKKMVTCICLILMFFVRSTCFSDNGMQSYQNFNHGYCPECDSRPCNGCNTPTGYAADAPPRTSCAPCPAPCPAPCGSSCDDPSAPICGTECGISICAIGIGIAAVVAAAAIIIASGNGSSSH